MSVRRSAIVAGDLRPLRFDHAFPSPGASATAHLIVMHGSPGTACFGAFHAAIKAIVERSGGGVAYAHRPVLPEACMASGEPRHPCVEFGSLEKLQLPGFGAEMAIKSMEYSAVDDAKRDTNATAEEGAGFGTVKGFDFDVLVARRPALREELLTFRDYLESSLSQDTTLKVWDMKDLGLQASQRILQASDPLKLLTEISQNFPMLASSLSRLSVDTKLRQSVATNQKIIPSRLGLVLLNGMPIDTDNFDLYDFLKRIRAEVKAKVLLMASGVRAQAVAPFLRLRAEDRSEDLEHLRFNVLPQEHVVFLNDLEKDSIYSSFPKSLTSLLNAFYPGDLLPIGRNLQTAMFIVDPTTVAGAALGKVVYELYQRLTPIRLGVLFLAPTVVDRLQNGIAAPLDWDALTDAEQLVRMFRMINSAFGSKAAFQFWASLDGLWTDDMKSARPLSPILGRAFVEAWARSAASPETKKGQVASRVTPSAALDQLRSGSGMAAGISLQVETAMEAAVERGLHFVDTPTMWLNGQMIEIGDSSTRAVIMHYALMEMQNLQEHIYYGKLSEQDKNLLAKILRLEKSLERYNPHVLPMGPGEEAEHVIVNVSSEFFQSLAFLHHPGTEETPKVATQLVTLDFGTTQGLRLFEAGLDFVFGSSGKSSRVAFLPWNSAESTPALRTLWDATSRNLPTKDLAVVWQGLRKDRSLWAALCDSETLSQVHNLVEDAELDVDIKGCLSADREFGSAESQRRAELAKSALGIEAGSAVVTNGRVVTSSHAGDLNSKDFVTMQLIASDYQMGQAIKYAIEEADEDAGSKQISDQVWQIASILHSTSVESSYTGAMVGRLQQGFKRLNGMEILWQTGDGVEPEFEIEAVLNPLSKGMQRLSEILTFIRSVLRPKITVQLNPAVDMSEMPLKQFYRFSLPKVDASKEGALTKVLPPVSYFSSLPTGKILTLNPDVPEAWLIEPVQADYDLDNLRMEDLGPNEVVFVEYRLASLLLTGSCLDKSAKTRKQLFPRGMQLTLGNASHPAMVDTLVMSNLGYFQLKASPGVWNLSLAPGRTKELYHIDVSTDASEGDLVFEPGQPAASKIQIDIDSFQGRNMRLKVRKYPGMEAVDVLDDPEEPQAEAGGQLWGTLMSWMKLDKGKEAVKLAGHTTGRCEHEDDPINIFTIASGHMYERLQKIMILSVLRNTKSCVKFWVIKNYMSPQMQQFLPHMAARYGFEYELVTYKWPSWLNKQTEKQRIIWAYKILFLDVLFPLSCRRVIFVDADQIVRTDMRQLYDMDLQGAPLAYTPFCDTNKEMDGFRFWKGGFWKDHLNGKPYHISALYVVDLQKFRQSAAGDKLRVVYENLSKDPNSLSNLDQDLPNYAQHSVPIFSLPQEWLWCESWCGNETKPAAKTIDLCNNPMTKEPKLQAARRIVAEWPGIDEEVRAFTARVEALIREQGDGVPESDADNVLGPSGPPADHEAAANAASKDADAESEHTHYSQVPGHEEL
ncbi:unnamed protein product [Ostreobium quekettii]|uniref:UDP-glucose:glycoprotein glucosyltransferase n=1 Tax=Ostreobium quekettii TaxID=121088 RepID=A0A8S1IYG4_9CHLO|nr:unnamed protein product [Ostreobium quekettii]|eukprot:evm.model.scf_599.5 EVM.evm.TU.scf_599.5   scf_599:29417-34188(+)